MNSKSMRQIPQSKYVNTISNNTHTPVTVVYHGFCRLPQASHLENVVRPGESVTFYRAQSIKIDNQFYSITHKHMVLCAYQNSALYMQ
ncbi:MAG: hypothetical protein NTX86_03775 [Candidatus Dependentiae bacterium]|nr:hypothetical protein [Candidatus Dependentiae bacterium]